MSRAQSVAASLNHSDTANIEGRVKVLNLFKGFLGTINEFTDRKVTYSSLTVRSLAVH